MYVFKKTIKEWGFNHAMTLKPKVKESYHNLQVYIFNFCFKCWPRWLWLPKEPPGGKIRYFARYFLLFHTLLGLYDERWLSEYYDDIWMRLWMMKRLYHYYLLYGKIFSLVCWKKPINKNTVIRTSSLFCVSKMKTRMTILLEPLLSANLYTTKGTKQKKQRQYNNNSGCLRLLAIVLQAA